MDAKLVHQKLARELARLNYNYRAHNLTASGTRQVNEHTICLRLLGLIMWLAQLKPLTNGSTGLLITILAGSRLCIDG